VLTGGLGLIEHPQRALAHLGRVLLVHRVPSLLQERNETQADSILTGSLAMVAPANAATPASVCGSGYRVIDTHDLGGLATMYLLYNGRTNCAVTWKTQGVGTRTSTGVSLGIWGSSGPAQVDAGMFTHYAGPVKVDAPGKCIGWGGAATSTSGRSVSWNSPGPSHCG
ncbi:hypothetical protein, partial [Nocardia cyriacigeorgica]|uniref:hypothetical protein n=1 Tax=Nocardia cyriacigeorgica TaxID=135487 RepID=UPI001E5AE0FF